MQHARFYLLPDLPVRASRYLLMAILGPLLALLCVVRHGAGILVAQSPYEGFAAAWVKRLANITGKRVALIVENHGDFEAAPFLQRRVLWPQAYRLLSARMAAFAFRHADALRVVSSATRRQVEAWSTGKPLVQFPAWTDFDLFSSNRRTNAEGPPIILFAGTVTPLKGVHVLLDAFAAVSANIPGVRLHIAGLAGDARYRRQLSAQAERLGVHGAMRFLGYLTQRDLASEMAGATVLVLPSLSEALGRVLLEAMASGIPVIGSRVGGIPDLIVDGQTGFLVPPGDAAALAVRLRWILTHPGEAYRMGQAARRHAQSIFSTRRYVQGFAELFQAVTVS